MCDFWSSVMNTTGRCSASPGACEIDREPRHFERWLALFADTTRSFSSRRWHSFS
jgi:hypothetical protein